ncbi:MAG: hypothetical protein U0998_02250 [Moraxellaceae bacterium]|nr:hypothetical protein [Moraxellaceae bacterium]MDZ4386024.1 hypothetical protein [Moraxellaceae bacterium]
MKKSLFLFVSNIAGLNTGRGGHYYTVVDHYRFFSEKYLVKVVCIGYEIPLALNGLEKDLIFIPYKNFLDVFKVINKVRSLFDSKECVNHAFDASAYLFVRMANFKKKSPLYFTKCGGAVRIGYTPSTHPDIVFHGEDYSHYKSLGAPLLDRVFLLIPNRVAADAVLVNKPKNLNLFPQEGINILRIARICTKYSESIQQTINLCRALKLEGLSVNLAIIGYPEDKDLVNKFHAELKGLGDLYISDDVTLNASRHLPEADIVIASGRGVMESSMLGKVTMIAARGRFFPVLLSEDIFEGAIYYNFSDRYACFEKPDSIQEILNILSFSENYKTHVNDALKLSQKYFSLGSVLSVYEDIYANESAASMVYSVKDIISHLFRFFIESIYRSVLKNDF